MYVSALDLRNYLLTVASYTKKVGLGELSERLQMWVFYDRLDINGVGMTYWQ